MQRYCSHNGSVCSFQQVSRKQLVPFGLLVATLVLISVPLRAQDAVLTDDAQVSTTTPNTPDGGAQIMRVRGATDRAFLKFSVDSSLFPPGTMGMFVGRATLKVYVDRVNTPGALQVAPALPGTPWVEATITNSNAPGLGPAAAPASSITTSQNWVTFDVTQLVQQWIDNPASNNGLAVLASGATDVEIDSKEDIPFIFGGGLLLSGHPAQLEVTLNHAATADAATLADNATKLGGTPAANYVQNNDPVLIGPRAPLPNSSFYIQNSTTQQPLANFNISGNGTVAGSVLIGPPAPPEAIPGIQDFATLIVHGTNYGEAKIQADQLGAILSLDSTIGGVRRDYTLENGVRGRPGVFAIFDRNAFDASSGDPFSGIRLQIDPTGLVTVPQSLSVGQTLNTNIFSANTVNAQTQFNLGGAHFLNTNQFQSTFIGLQAGVQNSNLGFESGGFNTFVGTLAGRSNTTGWANSFFGDTAGENNDTGTWNSYFGSGAGAFSKASENSYFGYHSGLNSTSSVNAFFGAFTGINATGGVNSFFGDSSGVNNTTGGANSFFGQSSGGNDTTGSLNSFFGVAAGTSTSTGQSNSAFGYLAGAGNDGTYADGYGNVFVGGGAASPLYNSFNIAPDSSHPSSRNTFVGVTSGLGNTTGSNNTLLGSATNVGTNNLTFATAIGAGSVVNTSNTITLGRNTGADAVQIPGMVAVGAAIPTSPLTVLGLIETDSAAGGVKFPDGSIQKSAAISGNVVKSLNGLINDVTLTPGSPNVIISQAGNNISIAAHADATAILNQTVLQSPANFNIDGNGTLGGTLSANTLNAVTSINLSGNPFISSIGPGDLFIGLSAGTMNTPDLASNNGVNNTFAGSNAGAANSSGAYNSFFGSKAGAATFEGRENSFFGSLAGIANTSGAENSFFGVNAGAANTTGGFNSFFGLGSGGGNTTGMGNSSFGDTAGSAIATGKANSILGLFAGSNPSYSAGSGNIFIGGFSAGSPVNFFYIPADYAGASAQNIFIGLHSGQGNTTGSSNTLLGSLTDLGANNLNFATAIGAGSVANTSNTITLGRNTGADAVQVPGMVAIGTAVPTSPLTVLGLIETDSTAGGIKFPDGSIQRSAATGAGGPVVKSLNGLINDVVLSAGSNITITPAGNALTIASTAVGGGNPILNQTTQQAGANFNIDGTGTANILNVATQYNQGGSRLIAESDTLDFTSNLFAGLNAGAANVFTAFAFGVAQSGFDNAYFGFEAGQNVIDGYENSYFGSHAGVGKATTGAGYENAAFGAFAGESLTTGYGNAFFGYSSGTKNTTGLGNTFVGDTVGSLNDSGSENVFVGENAGQFNISGSNNTALGANAGMPKVMSSLSFATAIGAGAVVDASNKIVLGRPTDLVTVPGTFQFTSSPSDIRLKTGVANVRYGLSELMQLRPVMWKWKADRNGKTQFGLIAQEVQPLIPELVVTGEDKDAMLSMNYIGLLPIVIHAIQEQQATIDELKKKLAVLQKNSTYTPMMTNVRLGLDSADARSVYNGEVTTDEVGEAVVLMPDDFETVNRKFRYQLTVIGQFAQAIIGSEMKARRFTIKTDKPNVKVSWQVTTEQKGYPGLEQTLIAGTDPKSP